MWWPSSTLIVAWRQTYLLGAAIAASWWQLTPAMLYADKPLELEGTCRHCDEEAIRDAVARRLIEQALPGQIDCD